MKVKVKFFAYLRDRLGIMDEFECNCSSPQELLEELLRRYPALREERDKYKESGLDLGILVNGTDLRHLKELPRGEVKVSVFPPAAGG